MIDEPTVEVTPPGAPGGLPNGNGLETTSFDPWLLALIGTHVVLAVLVFEPTLFPGADAGHYMVLGESLRNGFGFRDIHLPGTPWHGRFPPGYPALLAIAGWFGGLQLFKAVSLAATTLAVFLCYRIGEPLVGRSGALAAAGAFAISPVLLGFSHRVLSEAVFTALLLLAMLTGREGGKWWVGGLAAAAAAFFTRTAGLAILVAVLAYDLLERERRRALITLVVCAVCVIGWAAYQKLASPGRPGYLQQLVLLNPYDPAAGTAGPLDFPLRVARNLWRYVSAELPGSLGFPTDRRTTLTGTAVAGVAFGALALAGWLTTATRRLTIAHLVTACYVGLILLWPPVWTDRRFLLPVLPLLILWIVAGLGAVDARFGWRPALALGGFLAAAVTVFSLQASVRVMPTRLACQVAYRQGTPCDLPQYAEFYEMARWVAENTAPGAVVANRSPATFFLFSRRRGDVYPYSRDPDVVLGGLEDMGADFVVVDRLSATTRFYLIPAIEARFERFELVHAVGEEDGTVLLRLLPAPRTALGAAAP